MTATRETALYGLVGHPVAHSRSPFIHQRFAEQCGLRMRYELIDVAPGHFRSDVGSFRARGGRGLNVTLPYKGEACGYATRLSARARIAGAVNTLAWLDDGTLLGDNTDGAGLVTDLRENLGFDPLGRRILVMGAGGAARGAIQPLLDHRPAQLVIANRTVERAAALAVEFAALGPVEASPYATLSGCFDLILNATSASLSGAVPAVPEAVIGTDSLCYDMYYAKGPTAFLSWAAAAGCRRLADGTGMLVEQAADTFELWRGIRPDTSPVLEELRRSMGRDAVQSAPR